MDHESTPARAGARAPERGTAQAPKRETARGWYWLLFLPFFGTFFPWIYNTQSPELFGIPFFFWYQMAWVPISVLLTVIVYKATTKRGVR